MILITGGAGYIGAHVNKLINENGYQTIVLDNLKNSNQEMVKWGKFIKRDLNDENLISSIFKKYQIDIVIHLAELTSVSESVNNPSKYYENNYQYSVNLLNIAIRFNINKFIFSSTAAVYGNPKIIPISEKNACNPINPYGKSKLMFEEYLIKKSKEIENFNSVIFRFFNAAGADSNHEIGENHNPETHLIPIVLDVALGKRKKIGIFGADYPTPDGTCIRDYIHVNDIASAHLKVIDFLDKEKSDIFNLSMGKGFSVNEIIESCQRVTNSKIPHVIKNRRDGDPAILIADNKKVKKDLKWRTEFNQIDDIIKTSYNYQKKIN